MTNHQQQLSLLGDGDHTIEVAKYQADSVQIYADTPELLDEEFKRLPGDLAYWGERYAQALRLHLDAKAGAKVTRAKRELEIREKLRSEAPTDAKGKPERVTEGAVTCSLESDDQVIDADTAERIAEVEVQRIKVILDAIRAKRDMIIQLGAQYRAEMERDPSLRTRARDFRDENAPGPHR